MYFYGYFFFLKSFHYWFLIIEPFIFSFGLLSTSKYMCVYARVYMWGELELFCYLNGRSLTAKRLLFFQVDSIIQLFN